LPSALANWDPRPPRAMDQISLSAPLPFAKSTGSLSFINMVAANSTVNRVLAASISQQLPWNASMYATVFFDLADHRSAGVFAGLSIPLGADTTVSAGVSGGAGGGQAVTVDAQKTMQQQDGSYGWRVRDSEGTTAYREADASYRSGYGAVSLDAQEFGSVAGGSAELDGSVVAAGGGVLLGNRINDSFAVVDAGAPGVPVLQDNRPIGVTNPWGKLLDSDLRSNQNNRISIDPIGLPGDAEAAATEQTVVPARQSGVSVNFGVKTDVRGALVTLVGADGKFLPAGSRGTLVDSDESFVVGYDGKAYVKNLKPKNTVAIDLGDVECRAEFDYAPTPGKLATIGPTTCR